MVRQRSAKPLFAGSIPAAASIISNFRLHEEVQVVQINYRDREITAKIVYYGPALSGKTTNLQVIHEAINFSHPTKFFSLNTKNDRTLFFDLLPLSLGKINDLDIKIQLYTVPGQVQYNSTRKVVLAGCDAIVLVADSQKAEAEANLFSLTNMKSNLRANGLLLEQTPWLLQYNKRDLPDIMSVAEMNDMLNKNEEVKAFESVAITGDGVFTTFLEITKMMLESILTKYRMVRTDKELVEITGLVHNNLQELVNAYKDGKQKFSEADEAGVAGEVVTAGSSVEVGDPDEADPMEDTQSIQEETQAIDPAVAAQATQVITTPEQRMQYHPTTENTAVPAAAGGTPPAAPPEQVPPQQPVPQQAQPAPPPDPSAAAVQQRQVTTFQMGQSPSVDGQTQPPGEQEFLSNEQLVETAVQANMQMTELTNKLAESERQLTLKVAELQHLSEIGKALTSEHYLDRLLEMIINAAVEHLTVKYAAINLYDTERNYMEPRQLHGLTEDPIVTILKDKLVKFLEGITSKGKTAVITSSENKSLANALEKFDNYTSFISVSLQSKSRLLGVLNLYYKEEDTFRKEDLRFVILLANYASIAVENALIYDDMTGSKNFLESILHNTSDGILKFSPTNRIIYCNESAAKFLDYDRSILVGNQLSKIVPEPSLPSAEGFLKQAFLGNVMRVQPIKIKTRSGKEIDAYCTVAPIKTADKQILNSSMLIHIMPTGEVEKPETKTGGDFDKLVTALAAELEPQIVETVEKFEDLAKTIGDSGGDKLRISRSALEETRRIIDSVLKLKDVKRVAPPTDDKLEPVDVSDLLMSIIYMRQAEFDARRITLDIPSDLPTVKFPEAELTQVFNNVLSQASNSVNVDGASKINITHTTDAQNVAFHVQIGPTKPNLKVDEILGKEGSSDDVQGNVTMSLVKKLIEKSGGKVWIEQKASDTIMIGFSIPNT